MENVLSAFIIIFVVLFAALTLSHAFVSSQQMLQSAWQEMQTRTDIQARTSLSPVRTRITNGGTQVEFTLRNDGAVRLADFNRWDAILQYDDESDRYHIHWLRYATSAPAAGEWSVAGIYLNAEAGTAEAYEPGVLNPGEETVLHLEVPNAIKPGTTIEVLVSSASGVSASAFFTRNIPPILATNNVMTITANGSGTIGSALLSASDADDQASDLVYTVTVAPAQGALSPATGFTQEDINNNLVAYTHIGSGPDSFQFTLSDGDDTIGAYTFNIAVSEPPTLTTNAGLTVTSGGSASITDTLLESTDLDNLPTDLVYTVIALPNLGTLSLGTTFTQQDIDDGLLAYTNAGSGPDSFQFTVSDGKATIGTYTFNITVN